MKKDYMRGLKDALMQLYDGKDINRELRTSRRKSDKTSFQVKNPYLNLMLATTPSSFAAHTELLDITSGWLPRFLHFFPNHTKDKWMPLEEGVPENDILNAASVARLIKIRSEFYDLAEPRVMHLSSDAARFFVSWQKVREKEMISAKDDRRAQFYSRLAVYALKLSMLFTIGRADYKDSMEISLPHIQEACRLVDEYFMPMAMTVSDLVGKAADKNNLDKVIAILTAEGGKMKRRALGRKSHLKSKDLTETLDSLREFGEIEIVTVSNPRGEASVWVVLSTDHEKKNTVSTVITDIHDIPSHQDKEKDSYQNGDTKAGCDSMTSMPVVPVETEHGSKLDDDTLSGSSPHSIEDELKQAEKHETAKEVRDAELVAKYSKPKRFDVIYQPQGAALEYAQWACNIVKSPIKDKYKGVVGPQICSHGCLYCFNQQGTESGPVLKDGIIDRLNKDLLKLKNLIQPGERLEFTFVGDLYDPALPEGIARQCLVACKEAGIPFQVLTKGGMRAIRDFDIYGPGDWFGVTLTGRDEWEPGAASTEDRIASLQEAHGRDIKTWVSFEPVLDPERTLELIKRVDLFVDEIKIGKLNPKKHNPKEVKELADRIDWPKFYLDAVALCVRLGRVEGQGFVIKDDLKKLVQDKVKGKADDRSAIETDPAKEKFRANVRARSRNTCLICGEHFEVPLAIHYQNGYICEPCRRDGPPEPAKTEVQVTVDENQTTLEGAGA